MDIDEDDDFYAPEEAEAPAASSKQAEQKSKVDEKPPHELEEGEEEDQEGAMDEDDDSDIDIITERKDGSTSTAAAQPSRYSEIRNIPARTTSAEPIPKATPPVKKEKAQPDADVPALSTSKVDINAIPIHKDTGKPITQVNIDEDLPDSEKPWRKPGTDISDYFNYGFDEFTWSLYAAKQESLRNEYNQDLVAQSNKKMMEDINNMFMMGGGMMPGMPGAPAGPGAGNTAGAGGGAPGMPGMPGMEGMPPEMQAMMQQMMTSGVDPSQMDANAMSNMFAGMQNGGAAAGAGGGAQGAGQGQSFGGAGFGGNQGQGFGYDQQGMGGGGGRGNFGGGRGRRGGRNW